jgi:CDP-diglyceride synthetase
VTRVLSGAVLIAIAVSVVWFAPPVIFFAVAEILLLLAFIEYSRLADAAGVPLPVVAAGAVTLLASVGVSAIPSPRRPSRSTRSSCRGSYCSPR